MANLDKTDLIDSLFDAFETYFEARQKLEQAASEYTGYSPGFAPWRETRDNARDAIIEALDRYIEVATQ